MKSPQEQPLSSHISIIEVPPQQVLEELKPFGDIQVANPVVQPDIGGHVIVEGQHVPYFLIRSVRQTPRGMFSGGDISVFDLQQRSAAGYGTINLSTPGRGDEAADHPYVGNTRTLDGFERRGLGTRRLEVMDALSRRYFDSPLYSSLDAEGTNTLAAGPWRKLVERGRAEPTVVAGRQGWRFKA